MNMCIRTIVYSTWKEFVRDYKHDIYGKEYYVPREYLFRGQNNAKWELSSSFDRKYGSYEWQIRKKIEADLLKRFNENINRYLNKASEKEYSDLQLKGLAQHYGVPTRLLDWTYSPFIAAYFAFEGETTEHTGDVAIWVIQREHEIWNSDLGVEIVDEIVMENDRQKHQIGSFTLQNSPSLSLDNFIRECDRNGRNVAYALRKVMIPYSERRIALLDLYSMNINAAIIWGGYEGCARAARMDIDLTY